MPIRMSDMPNRPWESADVGFYGPIADLRVVAKYEHSRFPADFAK